MYIYKQLIAVISEIVYYEMSQVEFSIHYTLSVLHISIFKSTRAKDISNVDTYWYVLQVN